MKLSIIVPLYNADFFEFQIETLKKQTCSVGDFEIVYIDDGSDKNYQDFYKEVLEKSGLNYQYYYLDDKKGRARISEARNLGVVKSQSDDLVFIDADCLLPDYYISHLIQIVQDTSEPVILGRSIGYNHIHDAPSINPSDIVAGKYDIYKDSPLFQDFRDTGGYKKNWEVFIGGNFYIKKSLILDIGLWDTQIISWGGEDIDMGFRLYKKGYEGVFLNGIEVYNIKDEERINRRKILSFMKNQIHLVKKYDYDQEYISYIKGRFIHTPVIYKLGTLREVPEFQKIFFPRKKVLLYCNSSYGRGHFMRTLKIYRALKNQYDIRIVISGKYTAEFLHNIDYCIFQETDIQQLSEQEMQEKYFYDFLPDFFLVDFFPLGKFNFKQEIDTCINLCKKNGGKVYTYMRDIFDGQELQDTLSHKKINKFLYQDNFSQALIETYETKNEKFLGKILFERYIDENKVAGLLVFGDNKIYDLGKEYHFSEKYEKKITYLGYLLPNNLERRTKVNTKEIRIVVSSGGGFHNKKSFLKLLMYLSKFPFVTVDFFAGGDISIEDREYISDFLSKIPHVNFRDFGTSYHDFLFQADIFFFAGGYNSFCDALYYKIPCYILGYGQGNKKVQTNIGEIETRIQSFEKYSFVNRLYDFDISVIANILHEVGKSTGIGKELDSISLEGNLNILQFIQQKDNNET